MEVPSPVAPLDLAPQDDQHGSGVPPPPSPLSGCYLLIVIGEPYSQEHKDIILQRIAKGFLSWDSHTSLVDLEKELQALTVQAPEGEEAKNGERLIQYATENLVTEVLIHPQINTLVQCVRNLLSSFTRHRHLIHAGYTFAGNGSWILQDGTFSLADFTDAFQEVEVQRVLRAYENCVTVDVHCSPDGDWTTERLSREPFSRSCKVRVNPDDRLTAGSAPITNFINYISPFLKPASIENLLEPSEVVGNIRFSHPTLYVFPGGQGDAALFGINGFNMLVDGGFARKACFWDFARHLDRLDAVLVTRLNNGNVNGISSVLRRKKQAHVYPQIGHFFCNLQERRHAASPDGDKDRDPLLINLADEGQEMVQNLRQMQLKPHSCYREGNYVEPVNLYHKVGHGKLDMYIISPTKDSREVKEFLAKWNTNDARLFAGPKKDAKEFCFPLQNLISICALLVWQPANPNDTITRILFPGSSPQHKIFEGLEKLKHLEFLKFPVCSMKSISPSGSTVGISSKVGSKVKSTPAVLDKLLPGEKDIIKEASQKSASFEANKQMKSATIPVVPDVKSTKYAPLTATTPITKALPQIKNKTDRLTSKPDPLKKTEANKSLDGEKGTVKTERTTKPIEKKTEIKSKLDKTSSIKSRIESKPRSVERKVQKATTPTVEKKSEKSSPTTPKKTIESKTNGVASKNEIGKTSRSASKGRPSPTATPAKSAKDANNRKVVESKINVARVSSTARAMTKPTKADELAKSDRKPITRKPKTAPSPIKRAPGSPAKSSSVKSTPSVSVKSDKDGVIRKIKTDDKIATDSSAVSTPSTADPEKTIMKPEVMEENTTEGVVEAEVVQDVATEVEAKAAEEDDAKDISLTSEKAEDETEEDTGNKATDEDADSKDTVEEEIVVEVHVAQETAEKPDDSDMVNDEDAGDNKEDENSSVEPLESLQQAMNLGDKRGEIENEEEDAEGAEEDEEYLIVEKEEVDDSLRDQESADADVGKEGDMEDDGELKKQRDEVESEKEHKDLKQEVLDDIQDIGDANINEETKEDIDENEAIANEPKEVDSDEGIDIKEEKVTQKEDDDLEDNIIEEVEDKDTKEETKDEAEEDAKEIENVETKMETSDMISAENKEQLEEEVQEIISSAQEIISKNKLENDAKAEEEEEEEEGKDGVSDKRKSEEGDENKEVSSNSPEEKMDHSSEKNRETTEDNKETTEDNKEITEDTRDTDQRILDQEHDEYEVKRAASREIANQKYPAEDSQPDEKFSTTVESAATTAPTLPEDERIPLDEIKEIIEEKHVKEETKEKEVPEVVLMPRHEQPTTLPQVVIPGSTPIFPPHGVIHHRDIVKTPDEVADLPMHEEVDPGMYESDEFARDFNKVKDDSGSSKKESDELRHLSPELDIKGELQLKDEEKKLDTDEKEVEVEENVAVEETAQTAKKVVETESQPIQEETEHKDADVADKDEEKFTDDKKIPEEVCKDEEPLDSTLPDESTEVEVKNIDEHALSETEDEAEKGALPATEEEKPDSKEIKDIADPATSLIGEATKEDNIVAESNEELDEAGDKVIVSESEIPKDKAASKDLEEYKDKVVIDEKDPDFIKQVTMSFIEAEASAIANENLPQEPLESQSQVDSAIVDEKVDKEKEVTSTHLVTEEPSSDDNKQGDTQPPALDAEKSDFENIEKSNIDCDTKQELAAEEEKDMEEICEKQHVEDVKESPEHVSKIQGIEEIQDIVHSEDIHAPMTVSKETVDEQLEESIPPSELSATYLDIIDQVQQGETKPNLPSQDIEEIKMLDEKTEATSDNVADEEHAKSASPELKIEVDLRDVSQEKVLSDIPSKSADENGFPDATVDEEDQLETSDIPESNKELLGKGEPKEIDVSEILEKSTEDDKDVIKAKNEDIEKDTQELGVDEDVINKLEDDTNMSEKEKKSESEKGDLNEEEDQELDKEVVKKSGDDEENTEKVDRASTGNGTHDAEDELKVDDAVINKNGDDEGITEEVDHVATVNGHHDEGEEDFEKKQGEDQTQDSALKYPIQKNLEVTEQDKEANVASESATSSPKHELIEKSSEDMGQISITPSGKQDIVEQDDAEEIADEKDAQFNVETEPEHHVPVAVVSVITKDLNGKEHEENDQEEKTDKTDIIDAVKSTVDSLVSSFTDFGNDLLGKSDDKETEDTKIDETPVTDIDAKTEDGDVDIENMDGSPKRIKEMVTNEASVLDDVVDMCKTAVDNIAETITEQAEKVMQVFKSEGDDNEIKETDDKINNESNGVCKDDVPVNGMGKDSDQKAEIDVHVVEKSLDVVKSYIDDVESHIDDAKSKLENAKSHLDEEKSTLMKQSILSDLNRNASSDTLAIDTSSELMSGSEPEEESMKAMGSPKLVEFLVGDEKIVITETEKKPVSDGELKETSDVIEQGPTENGTEVPQAGPETASDKTDKSSVTSTIATSEPEHVLKPEQETSQATSDTDSDNAGTVKRMLVTASSEDGGTETEVCPTGSINFTTSLSTKPSSDNLTSMLPDDSKEGVEGLEKEETGIPTVTTCDIDGWPTDNKLSNSAEDKSDDEATVDKKDDTDISQQKHDANEQNIETSETSITDISIKEKVELVSQTQETKDTIEAVREILIEKSRTPSPTKSEPERADSRASDTVLEDTAVLDTSADRIKTSVSDIETASGKTTVTTVFTGLTKEDSEHTIKPDSGKQIKENVDNILSDSNTQEESDVMGGIAGFIKSAVNTGKEMVQEIGKSIGSVDFKTEEEIENEIEKIVSTEKVHEMVIDARTEVGNLVTETSKMSDHAVGASGVLSSVKKEDGNRSGTPGSDDIDMGGPLSPLSDISSGQVSRVPDMGHCDSDVDDDIAGSPVSTTSLLANSPLPSHFQYEIGDSHSSQPIDIRHTSSSLHYDPEHAMEFGTQHKDTALQMDSSMSSSFYGQLPPDPLHQLLEEREEQEASSASIVHSTRDPMTSSFYESRQDYTTDPKYETDFSHVTAGDPIISSHLGGFDDESEDLDFERAMHEHRTARGKDLTPSPTKSSYRHEVKFRSNGNDSPSHTSKYEHHTNGQNGKHHDDYLDDFGTKNGREMHVDEPLHIKEKVNGKSESHLMSSDSQIASAYQKEIFPTSPVKEVPGKVVTSVTASGTEHDPMFHSQVVTSATLPELPQGFGIPPGESSLAEVGFSGEKQDPIQGWGKPLGLPSPAPPPTSNGDVTSTNKSTPKKEKKPLLIKKSLTTENNKTNQKEGVAKKRPESPVKLPKKGVSNKDDGRGVKATGNPIYMDLTYVPHHGNSYYSNVEFFKKVRARYYVFSGTEPSREVYNALLEAKQTWDDKELEVTIIPTYDTDTLGYWVAENEDILAKHKIDLSPSASRCTINLQDHETSCSAYRLEF